MALKVLATIAAILTGSGAATAQQYHSPRERAWECIRSHESAGSGGPRANTGNGYFGAYQMDYGFMRRHGRDFLRRWGTANNWPLWAQTLVADRAWRTRGWAPWPNTARQCGLI